MAVHLLPTSQDPSRTPPLPNEKIPDPKTQEKLGRIFKKFGWDPSLPAAHPDFCRFLLKSKLLFAIRGYQHTIETGGTTPAGMEALKEGIRLDADGTPCILKEGQWARWDAIKDQFAYDKGKQHIHSKANPEEIWNYLYDPSTKEQGLVRGSRFGVIRPIYQLSENQIDALNIRNRCAFQVFTSDNMAVPKISHTGIRLINEKGWVYSLAFETTPEDPSFDEGQKIVGTYDVGITSNDYDEHRSFKSRRVTTLPLTQKKFQIAIERIAHYARSPLRFNRAHQNCVAYAADIAKSAGIEIPNLACPVYDFLAEALQESSPILRGIGKVISAVRQVLLRISRIPLLGYPFRAVLWLAHKIGIFAGNLLIVALGGKHSSSPKLLEHNLDNREKLTYFHKLVRDWKDLFKDNTSTIHSTIRLANWQLSQPSTVVHRYDGSPKFCF